MMCQNIKSIQAQINEQIGLVLKQVESLRFMPFYIHEMMKLNRPVFRHLQKMQIILEGIQCFALQDISKQSVMTGSDEDYGKKSYSQIIGIGQYYEQEKEANQEQNKKTTASQQDDLQAQEILSSKRGPYRSYTTKDKLHVIRMYKEGRSYAFICRNLKIPLKNIIRWCKNGVMRKTGAGRKTGDIDMQKKVIQWVDHDYIEGGQIKGKDIRNKAMQFSTKTQFKSSTGWLKNFLRRYALSQKYCIV